MWRENCLSILPLIHETVSEKSHLTEKGRTESPESFYEPCLDKVKYIYIKMDKIFNVHVVLTTWCSRPLWRHLVHLFERKGLVVEQAIKENLNIQGTITVDVLYFDLTYIKIMFGSAMATVKIKIS